MKKFRVIYGHGKTSDWISAPLDEVKEKAVQLGQFEQRDIKIVNAANELVAIRHWVEGEFDTGYSDSDDPVCLGDYGYYTNWQKK